MPRKNSADVIAAGVLSDCDKERVSYSSLVLALFKNKNVVKELEARDLDFKNALKMCKSVRSTVSTIKYASRYSGTKKAIIASTLEGVKKRHVSRVLQVHRKTVDAAQKQRDAWERDRANGDLVRRTQIKRSYHSTELPTRIIDWITNNTAPSSNTKNTVKVIRDGYLQDQVVHWRTDSLATMFESCKLDVWKKTGEKFSSSYFVKLIPKFVRVKKQQEGLCPIHYRGWKCIDEFKLKRRQWHFGLTGADKCACPCQYCSPDGCNHGKNPTKGGDCYMFTCTRCKGLKCKREYNSAQTAWVFPVQKERDGGGLYMENQATSGTRSEMMDFMKSEMATFLTHNEHVIYHKKQMTHLLDNLPKEQVVIKADFIQNIVHTRGRNTTASYYGKRQTQLLSCVVWFKKRDEYGNWNLKNFFVDYLSSYITHNSMFFQKCMEHLLTHIRDKHKVYFRKLWIDTDGGRSHFKSRISFFFASKLPSLFGTLFPEFFQSFAKTISGIVVHWIFAPSHHGKGECDSHGAVVKKEEHHVDDENEAVDFINTKIANSTAFKIDVAGDDVEEDCSSLRGSNSFYEFRFEDLEGDAFARTYPCFCDACLDEDFADCENKAYVGAFVYRKMSSKGFRIPNARFIEQEVVEDENVFVVKAIKNKRKKGGVVQYLLEWEGYEEYTWVNSDKLDCIELIEEYELAQSGRK